MFGFSLNIKDIEPTFTVGDLTRKRQQIILQLQEEGVFYLNKEIELPEVPQRIALISSETAAGYGDFIDQLKNNRFGYAFAIKLFQAYMQGNEAEASITNALDQIFEQADQFDAVVIIRGGGAQADLDCFNSYWLCSNIAQFPLPVLTGIGHDRDETIADLVAHTNLKTPTAVAEFLIAKLSDFDEYLNELGERAISQSQSLVEDWQKDVEMLSAKILSQVKLHMSREEQMLKSKAVLFRQAAKASILSQKQHLSHLTNRTQSKALTTVNYRRQNISMLQKNFVSSLKSHIKEETRRLNHWETANQLLDPVNVLQRGYSLTYLNGKITKSAKTINIGDQITTQWADSSATSTVNNTNTKA